MAQPNSHTVFECFDWVQVLRGINQGSLQGLLGCNLLGLRKEPHAMQCVVLMCQRFSFV